LADTNHNFAHRRYPCTEAQPHCEAVSGAHSKRFSGDRNHLEKHATRHSTVIDAHTIKVVERAQGLWSIDSDFQDVYWGTSLSPAELEAYVNVLWLVFVSQVAVATQASRHAGIKP